MSTLSPTNSNQVFLSFQGDELRYGFISHLVEAFDRQEFMCFEDVVDEHMRKEINTFFQRIEESNIALVFFTTRYAKSSWCMDELVKMKKSVDKGKLQVIPIFFKVKARDVRRQTGKFGQNFWELARVSNGDKIKKWKDALECISTKMGLFLGENSEEADFVKEIVKEVERVSAAVGRDDAEDHHCKKSRKNKKRKRHQSRGENVDRNVSNGGTQEEQRQEVITLEHGSDIYDSSV